MPEIDTPDRTDGRVGWSYYGEDYLLAADPAMHEHVLEVADESATD